MNVQLAPLICVRDVEASSRWYQRLLGFELQDYEAAVRRVDELRDPDGYMVVLTSPLPGSR